MFYVNLFMALLFAFFLGDDVNDFCRGEEVGPLRIGFHLFFMGINTLAVALFIYTRGAG